MQIPQQPTTCLSALQLTQADTPVHSESASTPATTAHSLARALGKARGILGRLCCTATPATVQSELTPTSPGRRPSIELQPQSPALATHSSVGAPRLLQPSASEAFRMRLFDSAGLSTDFQATIQKELMDRSVALTGKDPDFLFAFEPVMLPGQDRDGEHNFAFVTKPGHLAKLVLADLYQQKYGIQIRIQSKALDETTLGCLLMDTLIQSNGRPVGLVIQPERRPVEKGTRVAAPSRERLDHVAPVIIQSSPQGLDLINLDCLEDRSFNLTAALHLMKRDGVGIRRMVLDNPKRQADLHSCHTDAIQILKDALLVHQQTGGNLFDQYVSEYGIETGAPIRDELLEPYRIELPHHLYKGVQRTAALRQNPEALETAMFSTSPAANPDKDQTVAAHRARFSVAVEGRERPMNHFLVFKAYRNAFKVLEKLESFPDRPSLQSYIQTLRNQHDLS